MNKPNFAPNEIIGYRVHPDQWNWTVVVVKRHGPESKNAGKEYETSLAYCKNLEEATRWIFNHVSKVDGNKEQNKEFDFSGNAASLEALQNAFLKAQERALWAVKDLEQRMLALGLDLHKLTRKQLNENSKYDQDEQVLQSE